jgi:hypothetical protein
VSHRRAELTEGPEYGGQAVPQVQRVSAKLALCRTAALGGHTFECPKIDYFQVVFTLPEQLWPLMPGNRRPTYRLLFHAVEWPGKSGRKTRAGQRRGPA